MNLFTEKMDILRLFKKLLNDEKINFEPYNISDEGMFNIYKKIKFKHRLKLQVIYYINY